MKKILFLLFTAFMVNTVCACTFSQEKNNQTSQSVKEEGKVKHLNKEQFIEKVYNFEKNSDKWKFEGSRPAIVDFYATWCGPCKQIAPILEELAKEYDGKIDIYKVDTDKEKELAAAFGIRSIPTLLFIPKTGDPQIAQGALPKESLKQAIEEFLLGNKK